MDQTAALPRPRRLKLIAGAAAAVLVAIVVTVIVLLTGSEPVVARGYLNFNCYPCSSSINDDLKDGAQITVVDGSGDVIGNGTVKLVVIDDPSLSILSSYNRTFTFEITGVEGGHDRYGFHAGGPDRETMWVESDKMSEEIQLKIG
ncbi:hypothetical protein DL991_31785 [Amycolatopsis sp. WAC 01375]|uniref:hypothetical protein n=1 Tax=unclassified Amycolatopsis TaxID=2618356 RepID=UPI000F7B617F|nr:MULTISPECIES: hypothetical protein [unclassified Amycolatopsis]RSM73326.1 hypothetical protein DL991_31785 [Amycolatopsis sp. WAC 01375]RSN19927.1 hypothetical protein DL990_40910 [Amycolatopsis sp. WAC 01416]